MKLHFTILGLALVTGALAAPNIQMDRAWMRVSDPLIMGTNFNFKYSDLPTSGKVADQQKYWSSDYWARNKGGINYRWNSTNPRGFMLSSPSKQRALTMTQAELRALAPSEKWDLYLGRYDYPVKKEVNAYASPTRPSWEGICDGWAGAAMNHDEPQSSVLANPDGVQVPFGSSDVKALLSWYYAKKHSGGYAMMGRRCYGTTTTEDRCNHDLNAGAFHMVLANRVGVAGLSFIADMDRYKEVWNHLVYDFKSTVVNSNLAPSSTSAPGTVKRVRLSTSVKYVFLLSKNTWEPVLGTSGQKFSSRTYNYYLDLDADGDIIGGDWISTGRPDFLWLERKVSSFKGLFAKLSNLLNEMPVDSEEETENLLW